MWNLSGSGSYDRRRFLGNPAWFIMAPMMVCLHLLAIVASAQLSTGPTTGVTQPSAYEQQWQANRKAAQLAYQQNLALAKDQPHLLALPGILADRKTRTVRLWAQATGIDQDKPVEFFLIPENSGKDYEALAITFAKPSDIHKALQFIGVKPGHPVQTAQQKLWPKGERVVMTFHWHNTPAPTAPPQPHQARAEQLILDQRTGQPLPNWGLVFTGSYWVAPPPDESGQPIVGSTPVYAADVSGSKSIASNYNEPSTVLDLPRQALQGEVYGTQFFNPAYRFLPGQSLTILLEPEYKEGKLRVRDLVLETHVANSAGAGDGGQLKNVTFTLQDVPDGSQRQSLVVGKTFTHAVAALAQLCEAGHDPFINLMLNDRMSLATCAQVSKLLRSMEAPQGIRLEPPTSGHVSHHAFLPPARWREPAHRPTNRWELTLTASEGKVQGQLQMIEERWRLDAEPVIDKRQQTLADPGQLTQVLQQAHQPLHVQVLVFAPADLTYGQLRAWVTPLLQQNLAPAIFVGSPER